MTEIANGSLVKHVSLGVGKVVAVEATAVHVFFPQSDDRYAAKLRWPTARPMLTQQGIEPDEWLAGLTSFALDPKAGRYALAANFLSHDAAIAEFLARNPNGFADAAPAGAKKRQRGAAWRAASAAWAASLGEGVGERLLADGDLVEVVRRALRAATAVTAIPGTIEQAVLREALEPGDVVAAYFEALFGVLAARPPPRPRFEKLLSATSALGVEAELAWPMLTLLPSIADPARHLFLSPRGACASAARLGCDLRYSAVPAWATYSAWRGLAEGLLEELKVHGARDLSDVEVFLHGLATPVPRKRK